MAKCVLGRETERRNSSTANMHSMEANKHRLLDQVGQLQSELDRAAFQRDLIVGMELQEKDPRVSGYQDGKVVYKQPPETPDEKRFRIFGTHEFIGSGPYRKNGSWIQWGKRFKAPTHAEVHAFLKARDRRIAASKSRPSDGDGQDDLIMTFVKPWGIPAAAVTGWVNIDTDIGCCRPRYRNARYWINADNGYYPILNPILNPTSVFGTCRFRDTRYLTRRYRYSIHADIGMPDIDPDIDPDIGYSIADIVS
jgi:hypothetical protein